MKNPLLLGIVVVALAAGCTKKEGSQPATTNSQSNAQSTVGANPLKAPAEYVQGMVKAENLAVKTTDTASINRAIQMFNVSEGRNPKDLSELVTKKYLPKMPEPPPNMKFSYDAASGTVKVVPK